MIPAYTYQEIEKELSNRGRWSENVKMAGLLFARPTAALARTEIIQQMDYFHHRSGNNVHFFCGGYGAYWPPNEYKDKMAVERINGIQWYFSNRLFNQLREEIEARTSWRYSGGTDLLLFDVNTESSEQVVIQLKHAVLFSLDEMKQDGVILSVSRFFEEVFRFAENYKGSSAVEDFLSPPDTGNLSLASHNIKTLFKRMNEAWQRQDFSALLHTSASIFETMAKEIVRNPSVEDQSLGAFFEQYRKHSALSSDNLDLILQTYKLRNKTPLAGHGATRPPNVTREQAKGIMTITNDFVRREYQARAVRVST